MLAFIFKSYLIYHHTYVHVWKGDRVKQKQQFYITLWILVQQNAAQIQIYTDYNETEPLRLKGRSCCSQQCRIGKTTFSGEQDSVFWVAAWRGKVLG